MPYVKGFGYVKTGPRPRVRQAQVEYHNALMGTDSSGYSLRTRPDNYCLKCQYKWIPRGNNMSMKCPNCKSNCVVTSREIASFSKPSPPSLPTYWSSVAAIARIVLCFLSVIIFLILTQSESTVIFGLVFIVILPILSRKLLKPRADVRFKHKQEDFAQLIKIWESFCLNLEKEFQLWQTQIINESRVGGERCWSYSMYDYTQPFSPLFF